MRLHIRHRTLYRFDQPQRAIVQLARVTPASHWGQAVLGWQLAVGCDARVRPARDGYGNGLHMLYIDGPVTELAVEVSGEVMVQDRAGVVRNAPEPLPPAAFLRDTALTHAGPGVVDLAEQARAAADAPLERLHLLVRLLAGRLRFDTGGTDVARTAEAALGLGHGVCQDFTHALCAAARRLGIPARYVSGHLFRRDGAGEQPATHAWAEAWVADLGWVGFDAANGICPDDAYVRVAVGLDYREAAPFAGARRGGGAERLEVAVAVTEAGRPRSQGQSQGQGQAQWQAPGQWPQGGDR